MSYTLRCECGQNISVGVGSAGMTKLCACGRTILIPNLRELRTLERANKDIAPSTVDSKPLTPEEQAATRRINAGRQALLEVFVIAVVIEVVAVLVGAIWTHQISFGLVRLPIHLFCFMLLLTGVPGIRQVYCAFLAAIGAVSVYNFFGQQSKADILKGVGLLGGAIDLILAHQFYRSPDIRRFLADRWQAIDHRLRRAP